MAYTTVENIERRLAGWATVNTAPGLFGTTQLDADLVNQLIRQADARIDQVLRDRYVLPLTAVHAELESCSEALVLCKLIGQLYAGSEPSENGGYGAQLCRQGERELSALAKLDLANEQPLGAETAMPLSGDRAMPAIYATPNRAVAKIDPIRW